MKSILRIDLLSVWCMRQGEGGVNKRDATSVRRYSLCILHLTITYENLNLITRLCREVHVTALPTVEAEDAHSLAAEKERETNSSVRATAVERYVPQLFSLLNHSLPYNAMYNLICSFYSMYQRY